MHDIGFKFFLGVWDPDYTSRTMSAERYDEILLNLYGEVREPLLAEIHEHRDSCLALGYKGPFLSGLVDLTTVTGAEYITFSAKFSGANGVRKKIFWPPHQLVYSLLNVLTIHTYIEGHGGGGGSRRMRTMGECIGNSAWRGE